jgi:hypothetical protein
VLNRLSSRRWTTVLILYSRSAVSLAPRIATRHSFTPLPRSSGCNHGAFGPSSLPP